MLLFCCLLSAQSLWAQGDWNISLEGAFAFEAGRWIHDRGKFPDGTPEGWDRGTLSILIPLEGSINAHWKKWDFGLQYTRRHLFETYLIRSQSSMNDRQRVFVSQDRVRMKSGSVSAAYELAHRGKYYFSPKIGVGLFDIQTIHPEVDDFTRQWLISFAFVNEFRFKRVGYLIQPQYVTYQIKAGENGLAGEDHNIFGFGFQLGLRFYLLKPKA